MKNSGHSSHATRVQQVCSSALHESDQSVNEDPLSHSIRTKKCIYAGVNLLPLLPKLFIKMFLWMLLCAKFVNFAQVKTKNKNKLC